MMLEKDYINSVMKKHFKLLGAIGSKANVLLCLRLHLLNEHKLEPQSVIRRARPESNMDTCKLS